MLYPSTETNLIILMQVCPITFELQEVLQITMAGIPATMNAVLLLNPWSEAESLHFSHILTA